MGVIAKQSFYGTVVTYLGVAIGFVTTFVILTRYLTPTEIGLQRCLIDTATMLMTFGFCCTGSAVIRFYPSFHEGTDDHGLFTYSILIPLVALTFCCTTYGLLQPFLTKWLISKSPLFVDFYYLAIPLACAMTYQGIFETDASVLQHTVFPRFTREVLIRIGLLITYLLYAFHYTNLQGFIYSTIGVYIIAAICNMVFFITIGHVHFRLDVSFLRTHIPLLRQYLRYTIFLLLTALVNMVLPIVAGFCIMAHLGLEHAGIYTIVLNVSCMITVPYRALLNITAPQIATHLKEEAIPLLQRLLRQTTNNMFLICGLIGCFIWCNADAFFNLLPNGNIYLCAKNVLGVLCVAQVLYGVMPILNVTVDYSKYYFLSLGISLSTTIVSVIVNNYFITHYALYGAAIGTLLVVTFTSIASTFVVKYLLKVKPFGVACMRTTLLLVVLVVLNTLWDMFLLIPHHVLLNSLLKSVVLFGGTVVVIYHYQLSPELLNSVRGFLQRLK